MALYAGQLGVTSLGKPATTARVRRRDRPITTCLTLYALDVAQFAAGTPLDDAQLETAIEGHVLGRAVLEATASRP